jgi:hypothetical protein
MKKLSSESIEKAMKWAPLFAMEKAGLRVLTIPMLLKQLSKNKDDAAVMFFDWHNKGGEMSFPTELKTIDLADKIIRFHAWIGNKPPIDGGTLSGAQMVMFDTEGLQRFGRAYRGDIKTEPESHSLPKHLTVADFKRKLAGMNKNSFFAVRHHGNNFVSPEHLSIYNTETYPLEDREGNIIGAELKNGDLLTFGLGSTMSTDWGPFSFSIEPKQSEENIAENVVRKKVRKSLFEYFRGKSDVSEISSRKKKTTLLEYEPSFDVSPGPETNLPKIELSYERYMKSYDIVDNYKKLGPGTIFHGDSGYIDSNEELIERLKDDINDDIENRKEHNLDFPEDKLPEIGVKSADEIEFIPTRKYIEVFIKGYAVYWT